eukprot:345290-Alexandrium_andersonii.AAC.1
MLLRALPHLPCANGRKCMVLDCPRWHPPPKPSELPVLAAAPQPVGLPKRELCLPPGAAQRPASSLDASAGPK